MLIFPLVSEFLGCGRGHAVGTDGCGWEPHLNRQRVGLAEIQLRVWGAGSKAGCLGGVHQAVRGWDP